ncbi:MULTISPECIES: papain-like cysteine protease family protein [unclassified Variovorax]|jgi:peptidoglycan hydrolase-like protein with peptidoglycan-binding domain|uniref:papain-like cysteine protease family protein n=1 Tax=unclassified Variovorax TaxID=663243 RepID=UPI0013DF1D3E|nr:MULTISPECIES: papain-like cysteine protease family protein [unclassified Variovorax]
MTTLTQGSRGADVRRLQEALNRKLRPGPELALDGDYGPVTRMAVRRLQVAHWLAEDGEAGLCTQNVVFDNECHAPILHPVALIPQPTPGQCWAACTAMITRSNVQAVVARTPPGLIADDGGLCTFEDADEAMTADALFAAAHGLTVRPPASWSVGQLRAALHDGPLMLDLPWGAKGYAAGVGRPGHMVLVVGIRGDDDPGGRGTTLRIFDPWPPGKGARCSVNLHKWLQLVDPGACRVFLR